MDFNKNIILSINKVKIYPGEVFDFVRVYIMEGFGEIEGKCIIVYKRRKDNISISFSIQQYRYFTVNGGKMDIPNFDGFDFKSLPILTSEYFNKRNQSGLNFVDTFTVVKGNVEIEKHHPNLDVNQPIIGIGLDWMESSIIEKAQIKKRQTDYKENEYKEKLKLQKLEEKRIKFLSRKIDNKSDDEYDQSTQRCSFNYKKEDLYGVTFALKKITQPVVKTADFYEDAMNSKLTYVGFMGPTISFSIRTLFSFNLISSNIIRFHEFMEPENYIEYGDDLICIIPKQFKIVEVDDLIQNETKKVMFPYYYYKDFVEMKNKYLETKTYSKTEFNDFLSTFHGGPLEPRYVGAETSKQILIDMQNSMPLKRK
ncbi:hypothetical protein DR871_013800 [Flavobacterium petrolei]|uniref:Uncharacterized protein n=1 Tax=Flavobacterium petrolei TaxID=2259594 RepID=A0A482TEA4_9FLAO|nr:hypothetical protein [Flavobacterium petrolei]RYJ50995.1 hypothetical protein DR871_013800 [Flavobacterium petrolei]